MCKSAGLLILNGRVGKDKGIGNFTRVDTTGRSIVDYMVVSPQLLKLVSDFAIANACPESDHITLSLSLRCKSEKTYTCKTRYSAWEYDTNYMWSHETLHDLHCILKNDLSNKPRIQLMDVIALMLPVNEVAKSLTDYLTQAIDRVYPKRTTRPGPRRRGQHGLTGSVEKKKERQLELVSGLKPHPILNILDNKTKACRTCT